jgi:hypothetical protein
LGLFAGLEFETKQKRFGVALPGRSPALPYPPAPGS